MTYCVGLLLKQGLVMLSDTRTNAGVDNIATYRKLHVLEQPGERVIAVATAGNLSITQAVLSLITEGMPGPATEEPETLANVPSMFKAAQLVGRAVREIHRVHGASLEEHDMRFEVTILLGGQIKGGRLRLFMIYAAGNFMEATPDTPFLQIGEHKYGKPVLDRAVRYDTDLYEALKISLVSMDSTMRSNLAVGLPLDTIVLRRDAQETELNHRIDADDPYFEDLRSQWSNALRAAHEAIPRPPYTKR